MFDSCHVVKWSFLTLFFTASTTPDRLEGPRTWPNLRGNGTLLPLFTNLLSSDFLSKFRCHPRIKFFWYFSSENEKIFFALRLSEAREKGWNLFCDHIFDGLADCVFSLRSLWNLGRLWHPTTYAYQAFVYSYGNRIFMVFIGSEPIRGESGTCWVRFPLFYNDRIKIPAVKYTSE